MTSQLVDMPGNLYEPHRIVAEGAAGLTVLDIGCGYGTFADYARRCGAFRVDGVEPDPVRLADALPHLDNGVSALVGLPFDESSLLDGYDLITFFDVIEHIVDPVPALTWAADHLAEDGSIFTLVPNSAHYSFRKQILKGNWTYGDWGLFDRTHVRFYDVNTVTGPAEAAGLRVTGRWQFGSSTTLGRRLIALRPNLFAMHTLLRLQR